MLVSVLAKLGPYEDDLGIISVSFGFMLGPCWCHFEQLWDHVRMAWVLLRGHLSSFGGNVGVISNNLGIIQG